MARVQRFNIAILKQCLLSSVQAHLRASAFKTLQHAVASFEIHTNTFSHLTRFHFPARATRALDHNEVVELTRRYSFNALSIFTQHKCR